MFEISVLSCQHISIALEHPYLETMATIELDLTSMPNIKCDIFSMGGNYSSITSGLSRILKTCASIPITVRTLIKYWEREHSRGVDNSNLSLFRSQGGTISGKLHTLFPLNRTAFRIMFYPFFAQPTRSVKQLIVIWRMVRLEMAMRPNIGNLPT